MNANVIQDELQWSCATGGTERFEDDSRFLFFLDGNSDDEGWPARKGTPHHQANICRLACTRHAQHQHVSTGMPSGGSNMPPASTHNPKVAATASVKASKSGVHACMHTCMLASVKTSFVFSRSQGQLALVQKSVRHLWKLDQSVRDFFFFDLT